MHFLVVLAVPDKNVIAIMWLSFSCLQCSFQWLHSIHKLFSLQNYITGTAAQQASKEKEQPLQAELDSVEHIYQDKDQQILKLKEELQTKQKEMTTLSDQFEKMKKEMQEQKGTQNLRWLLMKPHLNIWHKCIMWLFCAMLTKRVFNTNMAAFHVCFTSYMLVASTCGISRECTHWVKYSNSNSVGIEWIHKPLVYISW